MQRCLALCLWMALACRPVAPPAAPPPPPPPLPPSTALPLPPAVTPAQVTAPVAPLDERLAVEVGQGESVLIDLQGDGVWAKSQGGARRERIVPGDFSAVWPDSAARLLWLWREQEGDLHAVDLTLPLPTAVTIAEHVPAGLAWLWPRRPQLGPEDARLRLSLRPSDVGFQFALPPRPGHWNAPRRWKACAPRRAPPTEPVCPALASGAELALRAWARRAAAAAPPAPLLPASPMPPGCSAASCGRPHALPGSHWWLVPAPVWSDCCRRGHQLYDVRARRFLRLGSGRLLPTPSSDRRDAVEFMWLCPLGDVVVSESGVIPLEPPGPLRFGEADACLGGRPLRTPSLPCPDGDQCEEPASDDPAEPAAD